MPPPYARFGPPSKDGANAEKMGSPLNYRYMTSKRGGLGKLALILLVVLLVVIALAVGLGVGLTRHKSHSSSSSSETAAATPSAPDLPFPIGEYSLETALDTVSTNCTSNAAIWRCYPYTTYSASAPTEALATFNWVLTNTSATYMTNQSLWITDSAGIVANISISASNNPFSISFSNESLTYINNESNPHFTFSFTQSKSTIPTVALTSDNAASECFFNQTQFIGTLYLSDTGGTPTADYPAASNGTSSSSYTAWPYAVDVQQVSGGGTDVPACYETNDGVVGSLVTGVLTAQAADDTCVCDYRNYGL